LRAAKKERKMLFYYDLMPTVSFYPNILDYSSLRGCYPLSSGKTFGLFERA